MRYDLSDFEWSVIQPHLPNKPRGVKRVDDGHIVGFATRRVVSTQKVAPGTPTDQGER